MKSIQRKSRVRVYTYRGETLDNNWIHHSVKKLNRELAPVLIVLLAVGIVYTLL